LYNIYIAHFTPHIFRTIYNVIVKQPTIQYHNNTWTVPISHNSKSHYR